jgi:hypothetical protein
MWDNAALPHIARASFQRASRFDERGSEARAASFLETTPRAAMSVYG